MKDRSTEFVFGRPFSGLNSYVAQVIELFLRIPDSIKPSKIVSVLENIA